MLFLERHVRSKLCTRVASPSRFAADLWGARYGAQAKMAVLRNGIEPRDWRPDAEAARRVRQRHDLQSAEIVLFAGPFRCVKGLDILLEAMAGVRAQRPGAVLLVAGKGRNYEEPLRELVRQLNIEKHVRFLGWLAPSDLREHFAAADIVAVPSRFDNFPSVVAEAMSGGAAVVAARVGGIPEMIDSPEVGRLVEPEDPAAMAKAICELLANPSERSAIGVAARRRVEQCLTIEKMMDARLTLYSALAAARSQS
jgi:glycogen(starch) synthase